MPYATKTSTLTGTFTNQAVPSAITLTANGAAISYTNLRTTVLSGAGAQASGLISVDIVPAAAGSVVYAMAPVSPASNAVTVPFTARVKAASEGYQVPAAIPFSAMAHGGAAPVGTLLESWPGFERNQLATNQHLVLNVDGQSIPIQQDGASFWSNSKVRATRTVWPMPVGLPADAVKNMTVSVAAGFPDRTPHITPQAIVAAHDYTLRLSGGDLGGTTLTASLRDIVTNFQKDDWGVNPLGGWDLYASGPYQVGIRGWRYVDAWRVAWLYVSMNSDGTFDMAGLVTAPNWDGPVANSPAAPTDAVSQHRVVCQIEAFQDASRVGAWGGPNDPRTATVLATVFNADNFVRGIDPSLTDGMCVTFAPASGGTLPSGVTAGKSYWLGSQYGDTAYSLHTSRADVQNYANLLPFGTAGSGNIIVTPMVSIHPFSGLTLMAPDARSIRIGAPRVNITVAWDEEYMSRGAKLFPRYETRDTRYPANSPGSLFFPQAMPLPYSLSDYGDNPGDDRIGIINQTALVWLQLPHDKEFAQLGRRNGACFSTFSIWISDIASGRMLVCDNGPDDAGARYPRLGPTRQGMAWNGYNVGPNPSTNYRSGDDWSGHSDGYSHGLLEASHLPCPWVVPVHLTGHPLFADMGAGEANSAQMYENHVEQHGNHTYYNIFADGQQLRGSGWLIRAWGMAETFTPASRPEAALIKHGLDMMAQWGAHTAFEVNANDLNVGHVGHSIHDPDTGFFHSIFCQGLGLELWRGDRPAMAVYGAAVANMMLGRYNDARADGGSGFFSAGYHPKMVDASGAAYPNVRAMIAGEGDLSNGVPPYPATKLQYDQNQTANDAFGTGTYPNLARGALALFASAGVVSMNGDNAEDVYALMKTRFETAPTLMPVYSSPGWGGRYGGSPLSFPPWAIVPG